MIPITNITDRERELAAQLEKKSSAIQKLWADRDALAAENARLKEALAEQPAQQQESIESIFIDGVSYAVPAQVAAEILRLHLEIKSIQHQGQADVIRDAQETPFEVWWEKYGQFLRAGGGQYEKTFAWHAWCESAKPAQQELVEIDACVTCRFGERCNQWSCTSDSHWKPLLPAQQHDPVGWVVEDGDDFGRVTVILDHEARMNLPVGTKVYTSPPQSNPLTGEQSLRIYNDATYAASLAVFMTRMDAEQPDADDKGVSGWLQEAEERVKRRIIKASHGIKEKNT